MSLKISHSSLFAKHYLIVDSGGVKYYDSSAFRTKRALFNQIECVLLSPDNKLSFQIGNETFSIATKPDNAKHQAVINALLQELRRSTTGGLASS